MILSDLQPNAEEDDSDASTAYDDDLQDYPSDWDDNDSTDHLRPFIELGKVLATNFALIAPEAPKTGRMLSFPNWVQVS